MEMRAQVSINPSTAALDRSDQNSTCCLSLPGQSGPTRQNKSGHTSSALHTSKFQPETAASPGCPSLPCPPALPASFCQLGFATFTLRTERALFAVNTTNRQREQNWKSVSHICATLEPGGVCPSNLCPSNLGQSGRIRGVGKDRWDSFLSSFWGAQG